MVEWGCFEPRAQMSLELRLSASMALAPSPSDSYSSSSNSNREVKVKDKRVPRAPGLLQTWATPSSRIPGSFPHCCWPHSPTPQAGDTEAPWARSRCPR